MYLKYEELDKEIADGIQLHIDCLLRGDVLELGKDLHHMPIPDYLVRGLLLSESTWYDKNNDAVDLAGRVFWSKDMSRVCLV